MANIPSLLDLMYASVSDVSRWQVFLDALTRALRAQRGGMLLRDLSREDYAVVCWSGWPDEDIRLYIERYSAMDPWRETSGDLSEGSVAADFEFCPRKKAESSAAFKEFYAPRNCIHGVGGVILVTDTGRSIVSLMRNAKSGPFGEPEKATLRALMPHLRRAALLHGELGSTRAQLATFTGHLDRYPHAFLLIDGERRVLYANASAREISSRKDGLTVEAGQLAVLLPAQDAALRETVSAVTSGRGAAMRRLEITRTSRKTPYRLLVAPVEAPGTIPLGVSMPAVSVLVIDSASPPKPDLSTLRELFSLTPSEARVAGNLAQGRNIEETATELAVSIETVRTHVKRVLSKTATSRQAELICLILRSAPFRES